MGFVIGISAGRVQMLLFFLAEGGQVPSFASLQRSNRAPLLKNRMADPGPGGAHDTNQAHSRVPKRIVSCSNCDCGIIRNAI